MEQVKVRELPEKPSINHSDYIIVEDQDGTKRTFVSNFRSLVLTSLYFNNVEEMKNSTNIGLKEGDICETLGYYTPGDGGGAKYKITYKPAAVEDGKLVHYLSYSDTLRAEIILGDVINVHQFGAKGDGKTDDTNAIQATVDNSDYRVVEFSNNKTYNIRNSIIINKSNTIINGNGATLYPQYVNGIEIANYDYSNITARVKNIIINSLNINCDKAVHAIDIYRSYDVNITNCDIMQVQNTGISINNSENINISNCHLDGTTINGTNISNSILITLNIDTFDNAPYNQLSNLMINIENCSFKIFKKAIYLATSNTGKDVINLDKCQFVGNSNSIGIYIACPIESLNMKSIIANEVVTLLYFGGASKGTVNCMDLSCEIARKAIFDIGSSDGILNLYGSLIINSTPFWDMNGTLSSNINWDLIEQDAHIDNLSTGKLFDKIHPVLYKPRGYSVSGSSISLESLRNLNVIWNSPTNLNEINNGVEGQLLYITSSTNKSIISVSDKIELSEPSIQLGKYKGILLKYDGLKWIQIG